MKVRRMAVEETSAAEEDEREEGEEENPILLLWEEQEEMIWLRPHRFPSAGQIHSFRKDRRQKHKVFILDIFRPRRSSVNQSIDRPINHISYS